MAHREVKINQNIRNDTKRIVKGEIPLGTDTQIKHEIRENYPKILEIKRRLKNCLSINCSFDEVLKYAGEYYGIDPEDLPTKRSLLAPRYKDLVKNKQQGGVEEKIRNNISPIRRPETVQQVRPVTCLPARPET